MSKAFLERKGHKMRTLPCELHRVAFLNYLFVSPRNTITSAISFAKEGGGSNATFVSLSPSNNKNNGRKTTTDFIIS